MFLSHLFGLYLIKTINRAKHVYIVCYSITSDASLTRAIEMLEKIEKLDDGRLSKSIIVVGKSYHIPHRHAHITH